MMFGDYQNIYRGRCPSISILWEEKVAVVVTDFTFSLYMSYYVGKIMPNTAIIWGSAQRYTTGKCPRIALVKKEDGIYAVEAHNPVFRLGRSSHYHVWKLNRDSDKMEGLMTGQEFDAGFYPKLCANTEGQVIALGEYQDKVVMSDIKFTSGSPCMTWKSLPLYQRIGSNPDIDMCGNKIVIAYTKYLMIRTIVGSINNGNVTIYEVVSAKKFGLYPSISLNSHNQVFLCYQTFTERKLKFLCGEISDSSVTLSDRMVITNHTPAGEYPSTYLTNEGHIIVVYKVPFGRILRFKRGNMPTTELTPRPANSRTTNELSLSTVQRPNGTDPPTEDARENYSNV